MGNLDSEGSDTDIDLESGGTTSEEDGGIVHDLSADQGKKVLRRTWSGFVGLNRSARVGNGLSSYDEVSISGRGSADNVNIISDQLAEDFVVSLEKNISREKKTSNSKNPSKPPRPPKGPLLDAADMKYVKEFSELARLKRRRVERMNKLKKKRSEQESSSSSNIIAMVVTCVFGFVIIFHGLLGSRA